MACKKNSSERFFLGNSTVDEPLRDRGVFSLEFFQHIWQRAYILLHPLPLEKVCSTVPGALCQNSSVPGRAWVLCAPQSTSTCILGVSCPLRQQRRKLSPFLCKETILFFFGMVCVCWAKRRVLSSPSNYQSLIALQIPHLRPPAVQIRLTLRYNCQKTIGPGIILLFDHLPLKTSNQ